MKTFLDEDFLLQTKTAHRLYHEAAKPMPIVDYHCHLSPQEVYEDRRYETITALWLAADHYKWRLMRANGTDESCVTGVSSDHDKFLAFAKTMEIAIGSPVFHWSHLELKRYFGYEGLLNSRTADHVYQFCNDKLASPEMSARQLILRSDVRIFCTTDDPADDLQWHIKLAADDSFPVKMLPAWRPDPVLYAEKEDFPRYLERLGKAADVTIESFETLQKALMKRMDFFAENGCKLADHGLAFVPFDPIPEEEADRILRKRLHDGALSREELLQYQTACMLFLGKEYAKRNWVMQLHAGVIRNLRSRLYEAVGADAGGDAIGDAISVSKLAQYLDALDREDLLPKTILYSLNANDNTLIDVLAGCFQDGTKKAKIQHGSAWWFQDTMRGMRAQMTSLAEQGLLAHFIGMLTDSRSFLSYARHEYFRRILCDLLGEWVEKGLFPDDFDNLKQIVEGICFRNAMAYFGF